MSGDYSRKTYDPKRDFSAVLMQQGRVQLDADWNEMMAILQRRLRAETTDIIGRGVVPKETPEGFKIGVAGGKITIGRGRIYVDGLLAENHGAGPLEFDPVLAEQRGTLALRYEDQPYLRNVAAVAPAPTEGGPYLIYLDVWTREVTYLENTDLLEKAVGVDTTTRLQTAWQVRVLEQIGANVNCATPDADISSWVELTRASDGRLTTAAVGVAKEKDPCVIPPSGGYRGLENRLYRVEIHDGGVAGKATFKWSRDNASIATSVTAITALDKLTVARVGCDNTLRFNAGDWIEITDDWREFAQLPGLMCRIKDVDDATQILTLTELLPAGIFPGNSEGNLDPLRHTRIKRWDQSGQVTNTSGKVLADLDLPGSAGVIPVPTAGNSIVLEDGVQITFNTAAGGNYHVGDFWTFAARTADASVEKLVAAPPRGIHHHYCRLAVLTFPGPPEDCRELWPPDCGGDSCSDCSECVTAESHNSGTKTIQQAIDKVKATGGTVCLDVGVYQLGETPVTIAGAKSVTLRGQGSATLLTFAGAGTALMIERSTDVTVERLALLATEQGKAAAPVVAVHNSSAVTLQRNAITHMGEGNLVTAAIGLGGILVGVLIRENILLAPLGISRLTVGTGEIKLSGNVPVLTADLVIEDNTLACRLTGIGFTGVCLHAFQTRIAGNLILGCSRAAIAMLGWVLPGSGLDVRNNEIHTAGEGIVIGTDDARIEGNNIAPLVLGVGGNGIRLMPGWDRTGMDRCQILGNRILGLTGNGIFVAGIVRTAMIKNNFIQLLGGGGIVMDDAAGAGEICVENNQLLNLAPLTNDAEIPVAGLRVVNAVRAEVVGNTVAGVGNAAVKNPSRAGIQLVNVSSGRVDGNGLAGLGPPLDFSGDTVGIEVLSAFAQMDLANNTVRRSLLVPDNRGKSTWFAVRIGSLPDKTFVMVSTALAYVAVAELVYTFAGGKLLVAPRGGEIAGLHGNFLSAFGQAPTVSVIATGVFTLANNRCLLVPGDRGRLPVVEGQVGALIASANYLEGQPKFPSLAVKLAAENGPYTVLGNISTGPIQINGGPLSAPWQPLNVIAP